MRKPQKKAKNFKSENKAIEYLKNQRRTIKIMVEKPIKQGIPSAHQRAVG